MAKLKKRRSKWYARVRVWDGLRETEIQIPLRTDSKVVARQRLLQVNAVEDDIRDGVITNIESFFPWLNEEGTSKVVRLGLKKAVVKFLQSRKQNNYRPTTIQIYTLALRHFTDMCGARYAVESICLSDINRFREEWSVHLQHSPTTINMNLRAIRTFLLWLVEAGDIDGFPKIKQVPVDEPEVKYLTEMQIADLFQLDLSKKNKFTAKGDVWVKDWEHFKRAFQFYLSTGCRLREPILGEIKGRWLDVPPTLSKNHKKRSIRLDAEKLKVLNEIRDRVFNHGNVDSAIRQYSRNFRKACDKLDISNDISFHSLRHTYACIRRLQTNGNMALVRDELGHKNISTTERYCNIPIERLEDDFPTYAKTGEFSFRDTDIRDTETIETESLIGD